jgi:hypothetical protein
LRAFAAVSDWRGGSAGAVRVSKRTLERGDFRVGGWLKLPCTLAGSVRADFETHVEKTR